ncbi:beta-alanine transporter [Hyalella azteca]|uniref:Beta-alanine transporter n=1 Tax=Hyalella azteca TaxID=294128 RepID=A0A979FIX1_HYAAZ|nr:beta-alanine transporter [Hyalella azteca]
MDFDEELKKVGEWGAYQRLILYSFLLPATLPCAFHAYNQLFMASTPPHWCKVPELERLAPYLSPEARRNLSIPYDNTRKRYSSCQMYDYNYTERLTSLGIINSSTAPPIGEGSDTVAPVVPCGEGGWHYQLPANSTSVVALVGGTCIIVWSKSQLGRHPSFYIYLTVLVVFGTATAFAPTFEVWLMCRVGAGFAVPAILSTPFVLGIELVGPHQRTYTSVMLNVAYSCGLILLAVVAYLVRDWQSLCLVTTLPFIVFFFAFKSHILLSYYFTLSLYFNKQNLLANYSSVNFLLLSTGAGEPPDFLQQAQERACLLQQTDECPSSVDAKPPAEDEGRRYGVLDLFRTPNLARKTVIITFIWFTNTSVYVGLSYYAPALGGDPYLNFLLAGLSELPTYLFLWPSMEFWGRRWTLCTSMIIGGAACIATVCVQEDAGLTLALYCVGKFGISSSFVALPLLASELYPTVVRGVGLSVSAVAGMLGPIVVPLINHLGSEMLVLPLMIMGGLLVLGGLFSLLLPETLHQVLPNTLQEGEQFGQNLSASDYCNCCPARRSNGRVSSTERQYGQLATAATQRPKNVN